MIGTCKCQVWFATHALSGSVRKKSWSLSLAWFQWGRISAAAPCPFQLKSACNKQRSGPISSRNLALWKKTSFWAGLNTAPAMDTDLRFHETVAPGLRSFLIRTGWFGMVKSRPPKMCLMRSPDSFRVAKPSSPGITNDKQPWMDRFVFCECQAGSLNADVHPSLSHGVYVIVIPQGDKRLWARMLPQKDFRVDTTVPAHVPHSQTASGDVRQTSSEELVLSCGRPWKLWKQGCMFSRNFAIYVQWHHLYTVVIFWVQQNF